MDVYYRVVEVWCKYPFNQEIDYRYCEFSLSKKKFQSKKLDITCPSQTTIEEKQDLLKSFLKIKKINIIKLK